MTSSVRCSALVLAVAAILGVGCPAPGPSSSELPSGVPIDDLPAAQRALLRVTLSIDDGVLEETELQLAGDRLRGDVALNNVAVDGEHLATLRLLGRFDKDAAEVLLGEAQKSVLVTAKGDTNLEFSKADVFDTCGSTDAAACAVRFDVNRNRSANLADLLPADKGGKGIDPAPQAAFLDVAPSSLQFPSGIEIGAFARQVLVLENAGANAVRVLRAEVVAAPGAGLALFDASGAPVTSSRRVLQADQFPINQEKNAELLIAVNFAPANAFFTTGAVHVVVEDTVTGVQQTARVKLIGNPDGALRVRGDDDTDADAFADLTLPVPVFTYPLDRLLSGLPTTSDDPALDGSGLGSTQGAVVVDDATLLADVGYLVELPAGQRLSASLGGLSSDIDLLVASLGAGDAIEGLACPTCIAQSAGTSPEGVDVENDSDATRRLLVLLSRVDVGGEPARVPFELTLLRTDAPSFLDDGPVSPVTGPLEGGVRVTLVGRGFDDRATVRVGDAAALDVDVSTDASSRLSTVNLTLPPGSLDPGKNPATIVVQNPAIADGGDGQAAVLPDGFLYQPPAPRLDSISPAVASTGDNTAPVLLTGAFFQRRLGPPQVLFDDTAVDAVFIDSAHLEVVPPSGRAAGTAFVTVQNQIDSDGTLSAPSTARPFRFLTATGPAPLIGTIAPGTASTDGGDVVTVSGQGFTSDCAVFVGGAAAPTVFGSATSLSVTVPPRIAGGRVDLVVVNGDGQAAVLRGGFEYVVPVPVLDAFFPDRATTTGGTLIVLSGSGFRPGARVRFIDATSTPTAAASVSVVSGRTLIAATPLLGAGAYTIEIENLDGSTTTSAGFSVFVPAGPGPRVLALEPASGSTAGGTDVTLFGRDLADLTVMVGAIELDDAAVTLVQGVGGEPDVVTFTTPPAVDGLAGVVVVQVLNGDGQSAAAAFTYLAGAADAPRIDDVSPARISGVRAVTVTIRGDQFDAGATVLVGGTLVAATLLDETTIVCTVPPRAAGSQAITITNPDGQQVSFGIEVTGPPVIAGLSTTSVHALVPGDQVIVIGDALDVDPIEDVTVTGPAGDEAGTVIEAKNGFLVVEVPALPGASGWGIDVAYTGGSLAGSPQTFTSVEPTIESVTPVNVSGVILLDVRGDALNPDHFESVTLTAGGLTSTCSPLSASETRVLCRPDPALVPGTDYSAALTWEGTFDGASIPVSLPALFVGTADPVVVTGQTLTVRQVDRALPADTNLGGLTLLVNVPGASLLPDMTALIDGVVIGDVVDIDGDDLVVLCFGGIFAVGPHELVINTGSIAYAVAGTVQFVAAAAEGLTPSTTTWPAGFAATGDFQAADVLIAVRVDDATITRPLPTSVEGTTATVSSTEILSAGGWTICTAVAVAAGPCAGPVLTVAGADAEVEGIDNALEPGSPTSGTHDDGDEWFFFANAGDPLVVDVTSTVPCDAGTAATLSLRGDRRLTSSVAPVFPANVAGNGCSALIAVTAPETGDYALSVSSSAAGGGYVVVVETAPIEREPNAPQPNPLVIVDDTAVCSGTLDATDVDLWSFTLPTAAAVEIGLDVFPSCAVPMRLKVLRGPAANGNVVAESFGQAPGACPVASSQVLPAGEYTVSVAQAPGQATRPTYALRWERAACGDGVVAGPEACDDGRNDDGDGCNVDCAIEGPAICFGAPSKCVRDVLFADDVEAGLNGWNVIGLADWTQVNAQGDLAWQWSLGADGDPTSVLVIDGALASPPINLSAVGPGDPAFLSLSHRDDELLGDATVHVEVLTANNTETPPGPVEPVNGYPNGDAWGCCTVNTGFVRDTFDLSPWAGATNLTVGLVVSGASQDAATVRWQLDDISVVATISGPVVPAEWTCSPSFFGTGDGCDCGCGALDLDCDGPTVDQCDYCDDLGSCNDGSGCPGVITADDNSTCSLR